MKKWFQDFPQMVSADDTERVEVTDMAAFAEEGGGYGIGGERPAIENGSAIFGRSKNFQG